MPVVVVVGMGVGMHGAVGVPVLVHVPMRRVVGMIVPVLMGMTLDRGLALATSADCTHGFDSRIYSTSRSLTRISVPPVACTW